MTEDMIKEAYSNAVISYVLPQFGGADKEELEVMIKSKLTTPNQILSSI